MSDAFGKNVDRLITVEMKRSGAPHAGVIEKLYDTAFAVQQRPLALLAAERLRDTVKPGDYVFIMTGSGKPPWRPRGETDGPLGAVSMARAIKLGLGGRPVYIAAEPYMSPITAASEAAGITPSDDRTMAEYDGFYPTALVRSFTLDPDAAPVQAKSLMDELKPAAVISIETLGPNEKGVIHSVTGFEREAEFVAHTYHLVEAANQRGILTIGVGDFGNEVGHGRISEQLKNREPYWSQCKCGCGGSTVCHVPCDVLVAAAVSNWGGYAVAACLAYLLRNPEIFQNEATEGHMGIDCVYAGAEGEGGMKQPWVDGTSPETQKAG
jgi:D-glutamate cyclase